MRIVQQITTKVHFSHESLQMGLKLGPTNAVCLASFRAVVRVRLNEATSAVCAPVPGGE